MSSEMRELLTKYEKRLANWTREHDQCATEWAYAHRRQCSDIVDDLRALLARTEAGADASVFEKCWLQIVDVLDEVRPEWHRDGDSAINNAVSTIRSLAAPVADGAVAWRVEWDEDNDGDAFYVTLDTERGAMGRANEAIAEGFKGVRIRRLVYGDTHPQDASGDAERYRVLRRALADPMFTSDALADAISGRNAKAIDAVVDAMQAKEAK